MIYHLALMSLIGMTFWAIFTPRIKDKLFVITALVLVAFGAMAMLAQSIAGWRVDVKANEVFVIGASIFALRCFYIKSGLKKRLCKRHCHK